jgi:hypothetical protein
MVSVSSFTAVLSIVKYEKVEQVSVVCGLRSL